MIFYGLWLLIEFIVMIKSDFFSHKKKLNRKLLTKYIILVIPIFIAILIPLLIHYLPLMIHYGSSSPNPVYMYGDLSIEHQTIFRDVFGQIKMFFNFKSIVFFAMGILAFIGLIFSCTSKSKKFSFLKKYYFFNFIARLHHYITKPLIGKWAFPHKMSLYKFVMPVFIMTGLVLIVKYLNKKKKLFGNLVLVLFIILLLIYVPSKVNQYNNDQWIQYGKIMDPGTQMIYDVGDHLKNIMSNEETILANDESSFALMALSGKKVVSSRRTHASYYVDIDKRIADTAIILYGNNNNLRKELISFYKISYFYEDRFIYTNPMTSRLDFQDYLLDNGVQFVINDITLDPARTLETGTIETRVVIPPQNMSSDFRDMLKMNKMFNIEGQVGAIIYHVDINTNTDINAVEENLNFS